MKTKLRLRALGRGYGLALLLLCSVVPQTSAAEPQDISQLLALDQKADRLYSAGKFSEALPVAQEALGLAEKAFGTDHAQTASAAYTLGLVHKALGDFAKAEPLFQRSLKINEKALGPEHPHVASELNNLAEQYRTTGAFAKAEPLYQRALKIRETALGPDDTDTATILTNLGSLYYSMDAFSKAEPLYQRALTIHEKALGPSNPNVATDLTNLAATCKKLGAFGKSESLYRRVLEMVEKALGPDDAVTATALDNLARLYLYTGDYAKAEPFFERALRIAEKAHGPDNPKTATALNNLAELYHATNEYAKAAPLLERALKIDEQSFGTDSAETATALNNLGELYQAQGNYVKAGPLLQRALMIREKALGPDHPDTAGSLNNLAELYKTRGEYARAEPLFERAVKSYEQRPASDSAGMARTFNNFAHLHYAKGDFSRAERLYRRALEIKEKTLGPDHPDTAATLSDLAQVYDSIADYAKAEALYQRALKIADKALSPDHSHTSTYVLGLAGIYYEMGEYTKAEPLYQRALKSKEKTLGPTHPQIATVLNSMARIHMLLRDYAKAEALYRRSLSIGESPFNLKGLARLYRTKGDDARAAEFYQRALSLIENSRGADHPETGDLMAELASLKVETGDPKKALELIKQALRAQEKSLSNVLSFTSEQQRLAFQRTTDPYSVLGSLGSAAELAQTVLRRKGIVLDSLLEDGLVARASADPKQHATIDQLRTAKERLTQLLLEVPKDLSAEAGKERAAEKEKLNREVENLEAGLARQTSELGKPRRALSVTVEQVQSTLPLHGVLVELLRYHQYRGKQKDAELSYGAVVIAGSAPPKWVSLGSAAEIKKKVTLYQRSVRGETDQTTLTTALRGLAEQVWTPIEKEFPPGTATVIISPEVDLSFVSFATLLTAEEKFVSEKYSIRYVASGRDLLKVVKAPPDKKTTMRVFANPDFGAATSISQEESASGMLRATETRSLQSIALPSLPGTEKESLELEALAKRSAWETQTSLGAKATEEELRKANSPRILHLATHGFFLPEPEPEGAPISGTQTMSEAPRAQLVNPMHRSGLAVAGATTTLHAWAKGEAPSTANDGIVTADEVGGLKLDGTWLVVLSACDTGSGEAKAGEGVMGLRRGFVQAGGQHLLMTLWPINDEVTVRIMLDFYEAAFKSGNAPQALADTQRDWLVKLRHEKGLLSAVRLAGPFIMSSQGK